tara:strand:- start:934 stop:2076 length:1143 start_codon:yes stop_codon:yes gene_type:complete
LKEYKMGVPKNFLKNINIKPVARNHERREQLWQEGMNASGTFVPKGVLYEDMDRDFIKLIEEDLVISVEGKEVPVFFLTMQRWAEFARTWKFTDKDRNVQMPFVTIVRNPDIQFGTNPVTQYTIPQKQRFDYMKVPNYDGDTMGYDIYRIPQPIAVNLTYQVRFFSYRMREINKFNKIIMQAFQSRQKYIKCNGHFFPVVLESIGDESTIDQFEQKRFYVQNFEMQLQGYIMDEDDYEVTPAIKRVMTLFETEPNISPSRSQTDGLNPEPELVEYSSEMIWEPGSLATPGLNKLTSEVIIDQSVLFTEFSLSNARDCAIISDDCTFISPLTQVSINDGVSFIYFNFPIQVLPGHILRSYLTVVDESIDSSMTVRGYINVI